MEGTILSVEYSCLLYHRLIDHKCVGLFLGSLIFSIDPYIIMMLLLLLLSHISRVRLCATP